MMIYRGGGGEMGQRENKEMKSEGRKHSVIKLKVLELLLEGKGMSQFLSVAVL